MYIKNTVIFPFILSAEMALRSRRQSKAIKRVSGFPGGAVVKNPPADAGDTGSSPGPGRSHMLQSS